MGKTLCLMVHYLLFGSGDIFIVWKKSRKRREERVTASKRNKFGEEGVRLGWDGMWKVEPLTRVSAEVKT